MGADSDQSIDSLIDGVVDSQAGDGGEPAPAVPASPAPAAPATTSLAKPAVSGATEPVPYPKSWKRDYEPQWGKIPRDVQEYVTGVREKDYLDGLEQYKTGHQQWGQISEVLAPYMPRINSLGMHPAEAVRALMNADWALSQGTPEQKVQMLAQICQNYGIDPRLLAGAAAGDPNAPQPTPMEMELRKKYDGLHANLNTFIQSQIAEKRSGIDKEVAAFAADPAHPYFVEVGDHIARLITADKKISLADAYEQAVWANPTTRAKEIARLNKENEDKARKEREEAAKRARQASSANVRGKPSDKGTGATAVGWEEDLHNTAAAIAKRS